MRGDALDHAVCAGYELGLGLETRGERRNSAASIRSSKEGRCYVRRHVLSLRVTYLTSNDDASGWCNEVCRLRCRSFSRNQS